ncbi:MAG: carboxypeptidase regulatory-like domain-containing protein [Polyangiaceae bacterium]
MRARSRLFFVAVAFLLVVAWLATRASRSQPKTPGDISAFGSSSASSSAASDEARARARDLAVGRAIAVLPGEARVDESATSAVLEGRVVSRADGRAVGGAELVFEGPGGARTTRSDDDGQFRFVSDAEGAFELALAMAPGYVAAANLLTVGARRGAVVRGVVVELTPDPTGDAGAPPLVPDSVQSADGATLRGRVRREGGREPITVFTVVLARRHGPLLTEVVLARAFADAAGEFVLRGAAPGEYEVRAVAAGYVVSAPTRVTLAASRTSDVELALVASCSVSGVVRSDKDGRPIARARVGLESSVAGPGITTATLADEAGRFSIAALEAGPSSIVISAPAHHSRIVGAGCDEGKTSRALGDVTLTALAPGEAPVVELTGIGAVLSVNGDAVVVGEVVAGGGAAMAGLLPGDRIHKVDDAAVDELGFRGVIEHIRGPEGTTVRLVTSRGDEEARPVVVERRRVRR